jgi:aryl-alcohol dehydrogenase-like predicted oxidoreductase
LKTGAVVAGSLVAARVATTLAAANAAPAQVAPNAARAGTIKLGDMVVNRIGFGAMRIAPGETEGRPDPTVEEAVRVLRRAVELGVNFIDTANVYGQGESETRIRKALYPYAKGLVITTKGGWLRPSMDPSAWDGSPKGLREACEGSLKRLGLERIDLYQYHIPDTKVPFEDSIGALAKLRQEGKIRHIGVSNVTLDQVKRARKIVPIVSVQNRYNIAYRASEEVLKYCEAEGLAFIPWAPLAREMVGGQPPGPANNPAFNPPEGFAERQAKIEKQHGLNKYQGGIAWLMSHSKQMLPIPGTTSVAHLEENIAAGAIRFSLEEMKTIG